jgi:hypothetical protein
MASGDGQRRRVPLIVGCSIAGILIAVRLVEKKRGVSEGGLEVRKARETNEEMDLCRRYMGAFRIALSAT